MIERLLEASGSAMVAAYQRRGRELEAQKALLSERIASCGQPRASFAETCRTAGAFLANPWKLWTSGRLEDRRAVLRLAFGDRLSHARNEGYRTAEISLPFKMIGDLKVPNSGGVVDLSGEESNQIFAEMARWEQVLKDTSLAKPPEPPSP